MDPVALKALFAVLEARRAGEDAPLDFAGADLRAAHLLCADLRGANLAGARLDRANLGGSCLSGARLDGASLVGGDLTGAELCGADLSDARLGGAQLTAADLRGAKVPGGLALSAASVAGARLDAAACERSGLDEAALVGLVAAGALLEDVASLPEAVRAAVAAAVAIESGPQSAPRSRTRRELEVERARRRKSLASDPHGAGDLVAGAPCSGPAEEIPSWRESLASIPEDVPAPSSDLRIDGETAVELEPMEPPPPTSRRTGAAAALDESPEPPPSRAGRAPMSSKSARVADRRPSRSAGTAAHVAEAPPDVGASSFVTRRVELGLASSGGGLLVVLAVMLVLHPLPPAWLIWALRLGVAVAAGLLTLGLPRLRVAVATAAQAAGVRLVPAAILGVVVYLVDASAMVSYRLHATLSSRDPAVRARAVRELTRAGHRRFDGEDLSSLDLSGADLSQASFRGANLSRANLAGAALMESIFDGADLSDADASGADFTGAALRQARGLSLAACDDTTKLPGGGACVDGHPAYDAGAAPPGPSSALAPPEDGAPQRGEGSVGTGAGAP